MAGALHARLVGIGASWLKREGFGVVATEIRVVGSVEEPDAIGFRSTCSAVIEVKVSRGDFLADAKKPHRQQPGLGNYRFFLCPEGLLLPDELPAGWGLLYAVGRGVRSIVRPPGNTWPSAGSKLAGWEVFKHPVNASAERAVLYSIARRLTSGKPA